MYYIVIHTLALKRDRKYVISLQEIQSGRSVDMPMENIK